MRKIFVFSAVITALIFSSCSKDMGALDPSYFSTNPNPLEVKGGVVNATVTGKFPVKYFNKNAVVTVTPVLKYAGGEVKGTPSVFQGEKVKANNKHIVYKVGGTYSLPVSFKYIPAMAVSELYLEFDVVQKKKTYTIPSVKVADGVIATPLLVSTDASQTAPAIIPDAFQKIIQEKQEADILFLINAADLRNSETKKGAITDLTKKIAEVKNQANLQVNKLEIAGYASPDGPIDNNEKLATKRESVTKNFLNKEIKKLKQSITIDSKFTAEDWDGFQQLLEKSDIQDKQQILRVLALYSDPEQREREIRNVAVAYQSIAESILPQLRRSRLNLILDIIGKSDTEIAQAAAENPSSLTVEELLYAATLTQSLSEKTTIYKTVAQIFPNDARGYNNLGVVNYTVGKYDEAQQAFAKAAAISSQQPDINYNLGLVSLTQGKLDDATQYFGKAAGTTGNLSKALGTLYVIEGDYNKAKTSLGQDVSNNAALLQILNKDYSAARATLNAVTAPDATTAYLQAVIGARTNDRDAVYNNLKEALKLNPTVAKKALTDVEFAKFFTDSTFTSILK
ncbi:MAG: hypothetical protein LBV31_01470 [Prevotellaceae bacterium]|jgi:Flp pilus assembly protein TadD/outer membrane protein OmpA-like peptidoglycan-associated protein|nr:hypothetical protein [Prevotellaceae bacterium]